MSVTHSSFISVFISRALFSNIVASLLTLRFITLCAWLLLSIACLTSPYYRFFTYHILFSPSQAKTHKMLSKLAFILASSNVVLSAPGLDVRQAVTIAVDSSKTFQTIDGFGISEFYGRAGDIKNLAATAQKKTLDLLFDPTTGAGFNILRNGIGSGPSSGFSIEPKSPGSPSAAPTYQWDGVDNNQVWLTQQAKTRGLKYIYADAWSAPGFMKTNGQDSNVRTIKIQWSIESSC